MKYQNRNLSAITPRPAIPLFKKGMGAMPNAPQAAKVVSGSQTVAGLPISRNNFADPPVPKPSLPILGVFVFSPGSENLRKLLVELTPRLDQLTGQRVHLSFLGNPHHRGNNFSEYLVTTGIDVSALNAEWQKEDRDPDSVRFRIARESETLIKTFELDREKLPALLLFDASTKRPVLLSFPRSLWDTRDGREVLRRFLCDRFAATNFDKALNSSLQKDKDKFEHLCIELQNQINRAGSEQQQQPTDWLRRWDEICAAIDKPSEWSESLKRLNENFNGPIPNLGKGTPPIVERKKLLAWWNNLQQLAIDKAEAKAEGKLPEPMPNWNKVGKNLYPDLGMHEK